MLRTLFLLAVIAACGGGESKQAEPTKAPPANGPVFSPIMANSLRAVAPDCKMQRAGGLEHRDCTGRFGAVTIDLGAGNRFSGLVVALPSKILAEAKGHIGNALKEVLGTEGVETLLGRMSLLDLGQSADLTIGNAKVNVTAGGRSRIAPEYTVTISWT